jgi:ribose transport system substrate-binding protein
VEGGFTSLHFYERLGRGGLFMKKLMMIYIVLIMTFGVFFYAYFFRDGSDSSWDQAYAGSMQGSIEEKYVMVTFLSGIDYWKSGLKGFEDAAEALGVSVEYRGATQYDVREQITVMEQVIARKPAGIALTAMNPEALVTTINKAVDAGIPVVLFDSGAAQSKAYSFLGTNNYNAGATAARQMGQLTGGSGKVAVITLPNQLNHQERTAGFRDVIASEFPNMRIVSVENGKGDQLVSEQVAQQLLARHRDLRGLFVTEANGGVGVGGAVKKANRLSNVSIISFDTDKGTLDMVRDGTISATMAQGTWNMGYWSLMHLFHLHHDLAQPVPDWENAGVPLLPTYVDTGISVVTKDNVEHYYAK